MNVFNAAFHAGECKKQIKLSNTQLSSAIVHENFLKLTKNLEVAVCFTFLVAMVEDSLSSIFYK